MSEHFIVWCPSCEVDIFDVESMPTKNEGVFVNQRTMLNHGPDKSGKRCSKCDVVLERKPHA